MPRPRKLYINARSTELGMKIEADPTLVAPERYAAFDAFVRRVHREMAAFFASADPDAAPTPVPRERSER